MCHISFAFALIHKLFGSNLFWSLAHMFSLVNNRRIRATSRVKTARAAIYRDKILPRDAGAPNVCFMHGVIVQDREEGSARDILTQEGHGQKIKTWQPSAFPCYRTRSGALSSSDLEQIP
ncbi:hypothetical protein ACJX0J_017547, partial [Zea mays]